MNAPNPLLDLATSLVQKGLVAAGAALATYFGMDQGNVTAALASLAPIIVGAAWGLWSKWKASKVAIAADKAGVNLATVKTSSVAAVKAGAGQPA